MTISCSLAIEGSKLLFLVSLSGVSRGRDAGSILQPRPCHQAWSMTRMPTGLGSSWHKGNLLDFRSSLSRTNASGRTNFSAARQHAFSIVFQHVLLFATAVFSPRFSTYPCKLSLMARDSAWLNICSLHDFPRTNTRQRLVPWASARG